ncbi:MAG: hypothetical protein QM601_09370 [Pseudoxanthomonas sp.]
MTLPSLARRLRRACPVLLACGLCAALPAAAAQTLTPAPPGSAPASTVADDDFLAAKQQADTDEHGLQPLQASAMQQAQQHLLDAAVQRCARTDADTKPFTVVAELDASGRIVRTWLLGDTTLARCFRADLAGKILPPPPRVPFDVSFEMSFAP